MRPDWQGLPGVPGLSTAPSLPAAGSARSTLLGGNVPPSPGSYRAAAAQAMPAVVNVLTTKAPRRKHPLTRDPFFKKFFGDRDRDGDEDDQSSLGSGVIVSPQGYILTNNHVVDSADEIQVVLADGRKAAARVVGTDPETDLAVIKVDLDKLPVIVLGHAEQAKVGDVVLAGQTSGRVRAMLDEHGDNIEVADPSRPAMVLGLTAVPGAGQNFIVVEDDRMARQIAEKREARERAAMQAKRRVRRTLEDFMASMEKGESQELNLILKGDVSGSVEALEDALAQIDVGDEVSLRVIDRGVGAITETNVDLAAASDAIIIGFNVRPQGKAGQMADKEGVEIRYYSVIYNAIEEIEAALKGMLKPVYEESTLGQAEIRAIFRSSKL
eukprot:gene24380-27574_t